MTYVMQDVVDRARKFLNDDDATDANRRDPDATLLEFANEWITIARRVRPDLFIGSFSALPEELTLTAAFPVDAEYLMPCVQFVVAAASAEESEFGSMPRAVLFEKLFANGMGAS